MVLLIDICTQQISCTKETSSLKLFSHAICCLFTFSKLTHVLDSGLPSEDMDFCGQGQLV